MSARTTQTARAITDISVLQVLAKALDEFVGDDEFDGDMDAPVMTAAHIISVIHNPGTAPVMSHAARHVPASLTAGTVHRLIDLKRRGLVKHERLPGTFAGRPVVTDLWSITLDGLAVARRGEL